MKIVILDDEITEIEKTETLIDDYFQSCRIKQYTVNTFSTPKEFMNWFSAGNRADIYILDIVMPEISGIDIGTYMKNIHSEAKIIYLTASAEYGVVSYDVQAADYLLKPCSPQRLKKAMDRIVNLKRRDMTPRFLIKVTDGIFALSQYDILYIEYYDHRLIVHTTDGKRIESITQREPLAAIAEPLLKEKNFLRISASFIVNMDHIIKLTKNGFEIAGGRTLQISRTYNGTRSEYLDYILKNN